MTNDELSTDDASAPTPIGGGDPEVWNGERIDVALMDDFAPRGFELETHLRQIESNTHHESGCPFFTAMRGVDCTCGSRPVYDAVAAIRAALARGCDK